MLISQFSGHLPRRRCACFRRYCLEQWMCFTVNLFYKWDGDVAQLVESQTGTPLTQVRFPGAARDFSPGVNFQCRLSYGVRTPPYAITCIDICAHMKNPVVNVRVRWTMQTLKHTACIHRKLGSATLSQLAFPGKSNPNFPWEKPQRENTAVKKERIKERSRTRIDYSLQLCKLICINMFLHTVPPAVCLESECGRLCQSQN